MRRFSGLAYASLIALIMASSAAHAAVITNGSFESPDIPGGSFFASFNPGEPIGSGWVVDAASASAILVLPEAAGVHPTVLDGDQYAVIGLAPDFATIRQDVALDAASYRLSFQLAAGETVSDAALTVDILQSGSSVLGGPTGFNVPTGSGFTEQSLDFTASTADSYRLVVTATGGATAIDAFQITAIPEPGTAVLLSLFAVPILLRRRRCRSRCA
ncbi:hypothetical protein [Planctomycetes bacterium TBK1r]|uniref:PEP-CTERM protein-sorting domain-containing protein n=1 Tax=Stieleria magnilauensis TaxID=2527963 RepID=A0ABX5Y551_9BACT|nr:hypothetical protein TBK1r_73770 [Planctomycetes bacterium TBK1r]